MPSSIMNLMQSEMAKDKEFDVIQFRNQRKSLRVSKYQIGTSNKKRDITRKALAPGKRISKAGKIYYENRKNRSDKVGSKL